MSDEQNKTSVLELLASRICHDIISPVGAISNGVELYEEMGAEGAEDAMQLIAHSAAQAGAKLKIFRMAYGAGGRDPIIKPADIHEAFDELIKLEGKITQDWDPHGDFLPEDRPEGYCKVLLCALLMAMECLPKGGSLSVCGGENGHTNITAKGPTVILRDGVQDALSNDMKLEDIDPRLIHPYVCGLLAKYCGQVIQIQGYSEENITFSFG